MYLYKYTSTRERMGAAYFTADVLAPQYGELVGLPYGIEKVVGITGQVERDCSEHYCIRIQLQTTLQSAQDLIRLTKRRNSLRPAGSFDASCARAFQPISQTNGDPRYSNYIQKPGNAG